MDFTNNVEKIFDIVFFLNFLPNGLDSYSKYKPQGIVKVLICYQMQKKKTQCSIFKFTPCGSFQIINEFLIKKKKLKN